MLEIKSTVLNLNTIEISACHGVYDFEKTKPQRFTIDISFKGNFDLAMTSDELQNTIDYGLVAQMIEEISKTHCHLIEHLTYKILVRLKAEFTQYEITVIVRKHTPQISPEISVTSTSFEARA
ncbi:MAG: dihydroneopterin aldolase [Chitinophagales bacterium]|jgi:dihydroneopterin aldolase|nr:dihydroneopterin aldolase [Chitinophagales bacterium]